MKKAARWIQRKRITSEPDKPHAGLLPAGFSAEHLGHNDYYYWDNFWAVAGLQAAARIMNRFGDTKSADHMSQLADNFRQDLEKSIAAIPEKQTITRFFSVTRPCVLQKLFTCP